MATTTPTDPNKQTDTGPTPWYQEVWFVVVVVVLILIFLFLLLLLLLRRFGPKEVYVRQRMPLPPPRPKLPRELFAVGAADASGISAGPGVGVVNPAFASPPHTPTSRRPGTGVHNPAFSTPQPTPTPRHRVPPSPTLSVTVAEPGDQGAESRLAEEGEMGRRETGDGESELAGRERDLLRVPGKESDEDKTKGDNVSYCSSTTKRMKFNATHM